MLPPTPRLPDDLFDALIRLTSLLNQRKVDYALIGGLGTAIRGSIRTTRDIDLLVSVPQIELARALEGLGQHGFQVDLVKCINDWSKDHLLEFFSGQIRVDWMKAVLPIFQRILQRARWEQIGNNRVRVVDAEGLLILKLIAFRPRDQEDIRGILASNAGALDLDWVRSEWSHLEKLDIGRREQFEQMIKEFYMPPTTSESSKP